MTHNAEFQVKSVIPKLIGGKIIGAVIDSTKEYFGFRVKKGKKVYTVWVDSDEEGNFCGSLRAEEEEPCHIDTVQQGKYEEE